MTTIAKVIWPWNWCFQPAHWCVWDWCTAVTHRTQPESDGCSFAAVLWTAVWALPRAHQPDSPDVPPDIAPSTRQPNYLLSDWRFPFRYFLLILLLSDFWLIPLKDLWLNYINSRYSLTKSLRPKTNFIFECYLIKIIIVYPPQPFCCQAAASNQPQFQKNRILNHRTSSERFDRTVVLLLTVSGRKSWKG